MARWSLTQKHYIMVPDTEWEHKETDRDTGKSVRKSFPVPRYLDPADPGDWTHRDLEAIIVCYEGKGQPKDIVFIGDPTPDMAPLDDEAQAISDSVAHKWIQPMGEGALPTHGDGGYAGAKMDGFLKEIAAIMAGQKPTGPVTIDQSADIEALKAQVAELTALLKSSAEKSERRA